jgi:galectin-4
VKLIFELFNLQEVPVAHQISDGKLEIGDKVELKGEPLEHAERY